MLLAHFTSINKLELILENLSFKFGCLQNTNDPYENKNIFFTYRIKRTNGGRLATLSDNYYKNEKTKDKFYILCFSCRSDRGELINKPRMWSQYGNNHNGCCIILNKDNFENSYSHLRHHQMDKSEINYDLNENYEKVETKSKELSRFVDEKTNIDKIRDFIWDNRDIYLFKKMRDWYEESEFRYCIYSSKTNDEIYLEIKDSIDCIVL